MNYINRAFKNLKHNISKTILLIITFFIIGNFVLVGLGVEKAAEKGKIALRKKMKAIITVEVDFEKIASKANDIEEETVRYKTIRENIEKAAIKYSEALEILKMKHVKFVDADWNLTLAPGGKTIADKGGAKFEEEIKSPLHNLNSFINSELLFKYNVMGSATVFENGENKIVEGSFYDSSDVENGNTVAVVSKKFAEINGLSIGSSFQVRPIYHLGPDIDESLMPKPEETLVTYTVKGIYEHNHGDSLDPHSSRLMNPNNTIYVPAFSLEKATLNVTNKLASAQIQKYRETFGADAPLPEGEGFKIQNEETIKQRLIHVLNVGVDDPINVDEVYNQLKNINENRKVNPHNQDFIKYSKPLESLSFFAKFIIGLIISNAIVIITLVTAITLKTREYEVGVLLSLGANKIKIIKQFVIELTLVAVIGFSLASVTGSLLAKQYGNNMLNAMISYSKVEKLKDKDSEFEHQADKRFSPFQNNVENNFKITDVTDNYQVNISPVLMVLLYVNGLAIVFISVLIPSIMIMRYNPKKILMNTN